eukprot:3798869-Prymnesium_polylepis.1
MDPPATCAAGTDAALQPAPMITLQPAPPRASRARCNVPFRLSMASHCESRYANTSLVRGSK